MSTLATATGKKCTYGIVTPNPRWRISKNCIAFHGIWTKTNRYITKLAGLKFQARANCPWLIEINERVKPQPGQGRPSMRLDEHISGKAVEAPGRNTEAEPLACIRNERAIITSDMQKNVPCIHNNPLAIEVSGDGSSAAT